MVQFKKREKVPRTVVVMSFTGLKRSLGQGNVFTPVCLSTGGTGVMMSLPVMDSTPCTAPTPWTAPPHTTPTSGQHHSPPLPVNKRTVRILLECFLVKNCANADQTVSRQFAMQVLGHYSTVRRTWRRTVHGG